MTGPVPSRSPLTSALEIKHGKLRGHTTSGTSAVVPRHAIPRNMTPDEHGSAVL